MKKERIPERLFHDTETIFTSARYTISEKVLIFFLDRLFPVKW